MKKDKKTFFVGNQFPVILEEDTGGGYIVSCPSFEGCYSQGKTIEEALKNIKEAILLCLDELKEKRQKLSFPKIGLHLVKVG
jgi:predicted RNase H-like HicB family nuclease